MKRKSIQIVGVILILGFIGGACTLPGVAPPTPFTFPTPNPTLTAIFAPASETPLIPTLTPLGTTEAPSPSSTPTPLPTVPPGARTRPNGSPIRARRAGEPLTIDGVLDEWGAEANPINYVVYGSGAWFGIGDLSALLYVQWDAAYLYLAYHITDDAFVQLASGETLYQGDSVEIQFDRDLAGDFNSTTLSADDYQIGVSPGNFSDLVSEAYLWFPESQAGPLNSADIAARSSSDGYDLEARIPWLIFDVAPQPGDHFGFAASLSDNDQSGAEVQQSLISSVRTRAFDDPTSWGTLILE